MYQMKTRSPIKKMLAAAAALLTAVPALVSMPAIPAAAAEGRVELDADGVLHLYGAFSKEDVQYYKCTGWDGGTYYYPNGRPSRVIAEEGAVFPADCSYLFNFYVKTESMDFSKADTSNVTNMSHMFYYCMNLPSVDLSSFDTSNVTDMSHMFSCCTDLTTLDLSSFDTSNVEDMQRMFYYNYKDIKKDFE